MSGAQGSGPEGGPEVESAMKSKSLFRRSNSDTATMTTPNVFRSQPISAAPHLLESKLWRWQPGRTRCQAYSFLIFIPAFGALFALGVILSSCFNDDHLFYCSRRDLLLWSTLPAVIAAAASFLLLLPGQGLKADLKSLATELTLYAAFHRIHAPDAHPALDAWQRRVGSSVETRTPFWYAGSPDRRRLIARALLRDGGKGRVDDVLRDEFEATWRLAGAPVPVLDLKATPGPHLGRRVRTSTVAAVPVPGLYDTFHPPLSSNLQSGLTEDLD